METKTSEEIKLISLNLFLATVSVVFVVAYLLSSPFEGRRIQRQEKKKENEILEIKLDFEKRISEINRKHKEELGEWSVMLARQSRLPQEVQESLVAERDILRDQKEQYYRELSLCKQNLDRLTRDVSELQSSISHLSAERDNLKNANEILSKVNYKIETDVRFLVIFALNSTGENLLKYIKSVFIPSLPDHVQKQLPGDSPPASA